MILPLILSELQYGVSKGKYKKQNLRRLEEFLIPFDVLPYDELVSKSYGDIRSKLEEQGCIIGSLDLLIAAHVLSRDLIFVANNKKEFKRIKSLKVENWV